MNSGRQKLLTRKEEVLLLHVKRFRLATIASVNQALYAGRQEEAAKKLLARTERRELLMRFEIHRRAFYAFTAKGASLIGAPRSTAQPIDTQALVERYACLAFCVLGPVKRHKLSPEELFALFPVLVDSAGIAPAIQNYYLDEAGPRLGRLTVDFGGTSRYIADKCQKILSDALKNPLREALENDEFVLTVLTSSETKKKSIEQALRHAALPDYVRVEVVSELSHLFGERNTPHAKTHVSR